MKTTSDPGFNLLDLLLALALAVIVMSISLQRFDAISDRIRLQSAARTLMSELNRARGLAISQNLTTRFEIREPPLEYGFGPPAGNWVWKPMGTGIRLEQKPGRAIEFHSRGSAAPAGTIEIANPAGRARIIVNVAGRVRVEELYED